MHHHISPGPQGLLVHDNPDVGRAPAQVPRDHIAGNIVRSLFGDRQTRPLPFKENHKVGDPPVINIGVWTVALRPPFMRICREGTLHVFMDFFLQVYANCAIAANDLVRAYARICRHVAARIWNAHIVRNISGQNGVYAQWRLLTIFVQIRCGEAGRNCFAPLRWQMTTTIQPPPKALTEGVGCLA